MRGNLQLWQPLPQMILLVAFNGDDATATLVQCDYFQRRFTAVPVSLGLQLRLRGRRKTVSLGDLQPIYRSLHPARLSEALEEAIGLDNLDYVIGQEADLNLILQPHGSQIRIVPTAQARFAEALENGRLVSSLDRKVLALLQRKLG